MATYSKEILSQSMNGLGLLIGSSASASPVTIHQTTGNASSTIDEVWLYAYNSASVSVELTVYFGGNSAPNNEIKVSLPSRSGLTLVVPGLILKGPGNTVSAFAGTTNVVTLSGYVNRIS
jgi:hypothetical protein